MTADDLSATVERLQAELQQLRAEHAAARAEDRAEIDALTQALAAADAREAATAEVLRVIASSPKDRTRVLDAIASAAGRLTASDNAMVQHVAGDLLIPVGRYGQSAEAARQGQDRLHDTPITTNTMSGRSLLERRTIHVPDVRAAVEREFPDSRLPHPRMGQRSQVTTPLVSEGHPIGVLAVQRQQLRAFTAQEIWLLETFAYQAVIAIENASLFEELQQRNRELQSSIRQVNEALEQRTATADVLKVIAESPTALAHVFETVAASALRLCNALGALIWRVEGDVMRCVASVGIEGSAYRGRAVGTTMPFTPTRVSGRAVLEARVIHIEDAHTEEMRREYPDSWGKGNQTSLHVPLLRDGAALGAIVVGRAGVRPFSAEQVARAADSPQRHHRLL